MLSVEVPTKYIVSLQLLIICSFSVTYSFPNSYFNTGFTAAHLSVKKDDLKNLKILVKKGADVNMSVGVKCFCLRKAGQIQEHEGCPNLFILGVVDVRDDLLWCANLSPSIYITLFC